MLSLLLFLACTATDKPVGDDTALDTAEGPQPAALAPLSSDSCPDLSASGTSTFVSSGEDRQVTIVLPESGVQAGAGINFFFHGLTEPTQTSNPGGDTASGLDFQAVANETGDIWVAPDSQVQNLYNIMDVYLWDLGLATDHDLVLYDDLRTCIAQKWEVDLKHVVAMGFSGGALFTTVVAVHRADTLATVIEMSGGSDLTVPGQDDLWSKYATPTTNFPVLLSTGGETDVWPSTQMVIVDFGAATDTFQGELRTDSHFGVRCEDDRGHSMNNKEWNLAQAWASAHTFGEPSPWEDGDLGDDADWCVIAE